MDKVRKLFKSKRTSSESRHISSVSFDTNEDKINENIPVDTNNVNDEYSDKRKEEHGKCLICNRYNTSKEWCQSCSPQLLTKGWTSGDETIDELIKATQLKATSYNNYHYLQWIPYDKLKDIEKISESGFTTVYKATWKDGSKHIDNKDHKIIEDRVIALKRSHRSHAILDEFLNEFKNYIKLSEGFSTIHIYGLTQDPTTKEYIFVMEYMKKGNLHNCIIKEFRNLKWQDKVMILYQINNGLQQIHGEKIIHRNLHSGNILEYNNYSLCIADLRFSIPVEQASTLNKGNVFGVLPYVAPEVLCGKPYTMASDIYSLGVLMSLISTGQEPFYDVAHDEDLAFRICEGLRPAFSTNTPKFYIELAYKCMDAKPENRPTVKDIAKIIYSWYDPVIKREFKEMDKIEFDPSIVTAFIHPDASYTSRLLAFSNLPEPLNSTKVTIVESNNETFQIDLKS